MTGRVVRAALVFVAVLAFASCGKSGGASVGGVNVCAMTAQPDALFGPHAEGVTGAKLDAFAGSCSWRSADGRRGGDVVLYTAQSMGSTTPAEQLHHLAQAWDATTETPLAPVAGLGDEAQIATDLPGYQTQIVWRKGDKVAAVLAWSGDPAITGEALARRMAHATAF